MDSLNKLDPIFVFNFFGQEISLNVIAFSMTYIVIAFLLIVAFLGTRKLKLVPGKTQNIFEILYEFLEEITLSTLGKKEGKSFVPFIFTLFVFVLAANWIGIIPNIMHLLGLAIAMVHKIFSSSAGEWAIDGITNTHFVYDPSTIYAFLFKFSGFREPTQYINTDLAIGILVFIIVHVNSIKKHGLLEYFRGYMGDIIPSKGWWILLFPINPFFYLNVISEISAVVSHSFRLFGNIFGGFMILLIVSSLVNHVLIPVGLLAFFGLFAGIVQAFVFTMLAITYIGQKN